eukprot:UN03370
MQRETVQGLSRISMIGNLVCDIIIFLYLLDSDNTSRLIIGTYAVQSSIALWKVLKVLKVQFSSGGVVMKKRTEEEKETHMHDASGMYYLAFILIPCVVCSAIYALFNYEYKIFLLLVYSFCS